MVAQVHEAVGPEVPGGEEADAVAEGCAGPDVEAAFERHLAVEVEDGDRHGQVEERHGAEPDDGLRASEAGGDADPCAADDAEDLREDEVAQTKLPLQAMARRFQRCGGGCSGFDGHLRLMFAQNRLRRRVFWRCVRVV